MDEIQGFGKGSGRHTNRCELCGQFIKRGILYQADHYKQHIGRIWIKINGIVLKSSKKDINKWIG